MRLFAPAIAAIALLTLAACGGATAPEITATDHQLGDPNAPVEVIEYASASCSHCGRWSAEVFPSFKAKYIDTGQVHYAMREILTQPTSYAASGFLLAQCAGKDRYFSVLEAVFRAQADTGTGGLRQPLLNVALAAGMTEEQFNACITNPTELAALNDRNEKNGKVVAAAVGAVGTPQFFFNGKPVGQGEITMEQIDAAMAEAQK